MTTLSQSIAYALVGVSNPVCEICGSPAFVSCGGKLLCQAQWQHGACLAPVSLPPAPEARQASSEETRYLVLSPFELAFEQSERELGARIGWPALVYDGVALIESNDGLHDALEERDRTIAELREQLEAALEGLGLDPECPYGTGQLRGEGYGWRMLDEQNQQTIAELREQLATAHEALGQSVAAMEQVEEECRPARPEWYLNISSEGQRMLRAALAAARKALQ